MSITSDEVNFLVFRYLQESGFQHSAFTFGNEAMLYRTQIDGTKIPPGALISFLQKGLQYVEIEHQVDEDAAEKSFDSAFGLLQAHRHLSSITAKPQPATDAQTQQVKDNGAAEQTIKKQRKEETNGLEELPTRTIDANDLIMLSGHTGPVMCVAFHPSIATSLVTGSGDGTARIWDTENRTCIVLASSATKGEVTSVDWAKTGTMVATASSDGVARLWTHTGELKNELRGHRGGMFAVRWSPDSEHLVTVSVDKTAVVWTAASGTQRQVVKCHTDAVMDIDWLDINTFATCSSDSTIAVTTIGGILPIKVWRGHKGDVNNIEWQPHRDLLASCSDDCTVRIWSLSAPTDDAVFVLQGHTKQVNNIRWHPAGKILASCSYDGTVRLWDTEKGVCLHTLSRHAGPVTSISFDPTGTFLVSVGQDKCAFVWRVNDGVCVTGVRGPAAAFEVAWSVSGDKLGIACLGGHVVVAPIK